MEDILLFSDIYKLEIEFGILLNFAMFFGFAIYKAMNLNHAQVVDLIAKYPVKTNYLKVAVLLFVPYLGTAYIFKELMALQYQISSGNGVYEYLENKLKKEYTKELANREE